MEPPPELTSPSNADDVADTLQESSSSSTSTDPISTTESISSWTSDIRSKLFDNPYQNIILVLIIARLIQILVSKLGNPRSNNASVAIEQTMEPPTRQSRLLNECPTSSRKTNETAKAMKIATEISEASIPCNNSSDDADAAADDTSNGRVSCGKPPSSSGDSTVRPNSSALPAPILPASDSNPWAASPAPNDAGPTSPDDTTSPSLTFLATTDHHPGLDAFYHWFDVEASLFRVYERARNDFEVSPPYNPSSRRGTVKIALQVVNATAHTRITVFWVDYLGRLVDKGTFGPGQTWNQTTWVDHPWVFCNEQETVLLHYIPYRVVPTTSQEPTTDPDNPNCGMHRFTIKDPKPNDAVFRCQVDDSVLPYPAADHFPSPEFALDKALLHCFRMNYHGWATLTTYLSKIVHHPDDSKYRQIRAANKRFATDVWMTPAKGVLLAMGFVEHGAYVELGNAGALSRERVQDVSRVLYLLEQWQRYAESGFLSEQPEGADGFGRAGYGRAGQMNF